MIDVLLMLALFLAVVVVGTVATAVHDAAARAWSGPAQRPLGRVAVPPRAPLRTERVAPVSQGVRSSAPRRPGARVVAVRVRA